MRSSFLLAKAQKIPAKNNKQPWRTKDISLSLSLFTFLIFSLWRSCFLPNVVFLVNPWTHAYQSLGELLHCPVSSCPIEQVAAWFRQSIKTMVVLHSFPFSFPLLSSSTTTYAFSHTLLPSSTQHHAKWVNLSTKTRILRKPAARSQTP